ncbi:gluconolaconase [Lacinutrix sp. Bg11-31]|uniref:gluconolaconase n=1 Tax=Lacinutrix sp. Bg11-31 TaxID=2057808 RepID=UPI000C31B6D7|nr:gluconolaconase [Lacinutrix sp. Bg11-31]AUC81833.1 gluconolaconase [Lacinutrix sp. Bg11-31]
MKLLKYTFLLSILVVMSCKEKKEQEALFPVDKTKVNNNSKTVSLELLWKTDALLTTSEAVRHNENKDVIYVANIGAVPPNAKDGDGTLSIIDTNGKIVTQNWVTGLNAPKGMNIFNGKLYVADIDEVVKVDIESGTIEKHFKIEGSKFLNDIDIDAQGSVYVTDTYGNKIYKITNDEVTEWKTFGDFNPNGIFVENNRILAVSYTKGDFIAIDKETKVETLLAKGIKGGDGIVSIAEGYIVSNWEGEVYFVSKTLKGEAATKILDTKDEKINAADIAIIPNKNILLIPTFFANTVDAYKINVN